MIRRNGKQKRVRMKGRKGKQRGRIDDVMNNGRIRKESKSKDK